MKLLRQKVELTLWYTAETVNFNEPNPYVRFKEGALLLCLKQIPMGRLHGGVQLLCLSPKGQIIRTEILLSDIPFHFEEVTQ